MYVCIVCIHECIYAYNMHAYMQTFMLADMYMHASMQAWIFTYRCVRAR